MTIVPKEQLPIDMEKLNEALLGERGYYAMLLASEKIHTQHLPILYHILPENRFRVSFHLKYLLVSALHSQDWSKEENKERAAKILTEIEAQAESGFNILNFIKASFSGGVFLNSI